MTASTVQAIAWTHFEPPANVPWSTDTDGGQALAEFAGRACYQSWTKPNPATATNAGYLRHIIDVGHLSVLEHGTVTMYMTGVSRSLTHELVRHRHFSYSQLSQRYVPAGRTGVVEPDVIADDPYLHRVFTDAISSIDAAYAELLHGLERKLGGQVLEDRCRSCAGLVKEIDRPAGDPVMFWCPRCDNIRSTSEVRPGTDITLVRKQARQAARAVLPNATETRIVVTGNYRAWRHFITMRATAAADVEIRQVAVLCLRELDRIAPNVFADYVISKLPDGTEVAEEAGPMGLAL